MRKDRRILRKVFPHFTLRVGDKEDAWKANANGINSFLSVWIWSGIDKPAATGAQELFEWNWRTLVGLAAAVVAGAAIGAASYFFAPWLWGLALLGAWAAFILFPQLHFVQRYKELLSHEIESQCAWLLYGESPTAHRLGEIGDREHLEQGGMVSYAWLKGMSEEEIYDAMEAKAGRAIRWMKRHILFLRKVQIAASEMSPE